MSEHPKNAAFVHEDDRSITEKPVEPIHPWRWRLLSVWIVIFTFANFWLVHQNRDQTNEIQNQRYSAILQVCQDTNMRHDNTIVTLNTILSERSKGASEETKRRLEESRALTTLLINSLVPKSKNCKASARRTVEGG